MPAFTDIPTGKTPAAAVDIQQVIDALTARRNTPLSSLITDTINPNFTARNVDPSSRVMTLYASDGTTVLFSVDATGVKVSPDGTAAVPPLTSVGPGASPQVAAGNHVHGAGGYASTGTTTLEALFAGTWITRSADYGAAGTFGAAIMFVFCTSGITVTLPDAATTNRPITVVAITGTTTVASAGGSVVGGSVNTSTGAVMNGTVSPGDAITYKSDGTSWRAV